MKYLLILSLIIISCTPQRRFDRLIKKNPWLLTKDTIRIKDTIRDTIRITVPEVKVDTVVEYETLYDTIFLKKDQLKTPWYKTLLNNLIGILLTLLLVYFTYRILRKHLI